MVFFILQHVCILGFLYFCFTRVFKKYITAPSSRNDDYYLTVATLGLFLAYMVQFAILLSGYTIGLAFLAHSAKVFSFWGFMSFVVNQIYFRNIRAFRLHKILSTIIMFMVVMLAATILLNGRREIQITSIEMLMYSVSNIPVDLLFDFTYLTVSIAAALASKKIKIGPKNLLTIGTILSSVYYTLFILNNILFSGTNVILFSIANIVGIFAVMSVIIVVMCYYKKRRKI